MGSILYFLEVGGWDARFISTNKNDIERIKQKARREFGDDVRLFERKLKPGSKFNTNPDGWVVVK